MNIKNYDRLDNRKLDIFLATVNQTLPFITKFTIKVINVGE